MIDLPDRTASAGTAGLNRHGARSYRTILRLGAARRQGRLSTGTLEFDSRRS